MDAEREAKLATVASDITEIMEAHKLNAGEYALVLQRCYVTLTFAAISKEKWEEALHRFVDICRYDLKRMDEDPEVQAFMKEK